MKLTVKPEQREAVFAGATDPDAQREALLQYMQQDNPKGIRIELSKDEAASLSDTSPGSVLEFARQKVAAGPPKSVKTVSAPRGPGADTIAYQIARKVRGIPRSAIREGTTEFAQSQADLLEAGLRSGTMPRVADKIDEETPSTLLGSKTVMEQAIDYVDFGLSIPGILKVVSKKAPVLATVARPMFAGLSANADLRALQDMTPEDRSSWLSTLEEGQELKPVYGELIKALDEWDAGADARRGTADELADPLSYDPLKKAKMKLAWQYLTPWGNDGFFKGGTADPYGGSAPRPWGEDAADAVDVVMRGALGFDDDDVAKYRPQVQKLSSALGMPFREAMSVIRTRPELQETLTAAMAAQNVSPTLKLIGSAAGGQESAAKWFNDYKEDARVARDEHKKKIASGDRTAGMTFLNLMLMTGPDFALPSGPKMAELVDTPIGKITRQAEAGRLADTLSHQKKIEDEASQLLGRKLNAEEVEELRARTASAVDTLYARAKDFDDGVVLGIDTADALKVINNSDGLRVVPDPSKVVVDVRPKRRMVDELMVPVEGEMPLFPKRDAPLFAAAKKAGGTLVGVLGEGEGSLGLAILSGAERARRVFGKGTALVVQDPITKKWRKPLATDLIVGDARMKLFRNFVGARARSNMNFLRAEMNDAAKAIMNGTENPQQRILAGKFQEVLGHVPQTNAEAGELFLAMEKKISEGLRVLPRVIDDLGRAERKAGRAADKAERALAKAQKKLTTADSAVTKRQKKLDDLRQELSLAEEGARLELQDHIRDTPTYQTGSVQWNAEPLEGYVLLEASPKQLVRMGDLRAGLFETLDVGDAQILDVGKLRKAEEFISGGNRVNPPRVATNPKNGQVQLVFDDGRHRTAAAYRAKEADIPVHVREESVEALMQAGFRPIADDSLVRGLVPPPDAYDISLRVIDQIKTEIDDALTALDAARKKRDVRAADLKAARPAARAARGASDDAVVTRGLAERRASSIGAAPDSLDDRALRQIDLQSQRAEVLADIMEGLTGARNATEAQARRQLGQELRSLEQRAKAVASDADLVKALDNLTLSEVKIAERAWRRAAKNGFKDFKEFEELPPNAKKAVEAMKEYFDSLYRRMKASGRLGDKITKAQFFEKNLVDGYLPHMMSKAGRRQLSKRLTEAGRGGSPWRNVIDATKERLKQGTVEEINQAYREEIADMIRRDAIDLGKTPAEAQQLFDEWMVKLKDDVYFENDPLRILPRYAEDTARGLANTAMIKDVINLFPEGERFAGVAKDIGLEAADKQAAAEGFRRVDGFTLLRTFDPELALWRGWKKHANTLSKLDGFPPEKVDEVLEQLRKLGAPIGDTVTAGTRPELGKPVYMPAMIADELDRMSSPSMWANVPDDLKQTMREYTAVWKSAMTVLAIAFHGRNYASNVLASWLSNGWDAVSPSTQMTAHQVLLASDNKMLTIGNTTMSAKDWRREFRREGVIQDTVGYVGDEIRQDTKIRKRRALKIGAGTAAAGAAVGAATAEKEEDRLRRAFGFGILGLQAGVAGSASADLFFRDALRAGQSTRKAALEEGRSIAEANKARWTAAKEQVFTDLAEPLRRAGRVGLANSVVGAIWGFGTGDMIGATALAGGGAAAFSPVLEAAAVVGGSVGSHIEDMAKIGNAIAELKKGGSMSAAAEAARRATFDYQDLTRVEREVFRVAMPFYTWTAKNIALQADLMVNNPKRYALLAKAMNALSYEGEGFALDDYMGHRWLVGLGSGAILAGTGSGPESAVELLTKDWRGFASNANPMAKAVVERIIGDSFFYKAPVTQITSGRDYESMPAWIQKTVGYRDDIIDPRNPDRKIGAKLGWYEISNEELARLSSGSIPFQRLMEMEVARNPEGKMFLRDVKRGTYWHQLFSAHPTKRLLMEFNKAMKRSFQSALQEEEGRGATAMERFINLGLSFKATEHPEQDEEVLRKARNEILLDKMDRMMQAMVENGLAYESINMPAMYQAPADKYIPSPTDGR